MRAEPPPAPLAVVGVGLATAVGSSALASVAALRAGVARFREVPGVEVPNRGLTANEPVVAARSPLHVDGLAPAEVARALLRVAQADAGRRAGPDAWDPLPVQISPGEGLNRSGILDRLFALAEHTERAQTAVGLSVSDSLTAAGTLMHYAEAGRLKGSVAPSGFVPGEAAVALVLQREPDARAADRTPLAVVEGWGRGHEAVPLGGSLPSHAIGLTDAITSALDGLPPGGPPGLVVADLNGERGRALEWALAAPRALPYWEGRLPLWTPADGAGECGRATGALLVACAVVALARGWAGTERVLVVSSDDDGARRAVVLRAVDGAGPG